MQGNFLKTFSSNAFWLLVSELVNKFLLLGVSVLLARYLGVGKFGQLAFTISICTVLGVFSDAGLSVILTREISRKKVNLISYLNNIIAIKLVLFLTLGILLFILSKILVLEDQETWVIIAIFLWVISTYYNEIFRALFRGLNQFRYEAVGKSIESFCLFLSILLVIILKQDLLFVGLSYASSSLVGLFYYMFLLKKRHLLFKPVFDKKIWRRLIVLGLPFLSINLLLILYFQMSTLLLGLFRTKEEIGLFNAAYNLATVFFIIPRIIVGGAFPLMAEYFEKSFDRLEKIHFFIFKYFVVLIALIGPFVSFRSKEILSLLYGDTYLGSSVVLSILVWMGLLLMINNLFGQTFVAIDKEKIGLYTVSLVLFVNFILNLYLIPLFGIIGAALALLVSEIIFEIISLVFISKKFPLLTYLKLLMKPAILGLVLLTLTIKSGSFDLVTGGVVYAIGGIIGIFILRIIEKSDYVLIQRILPFSKKLHH